MISATVFSKKWDCIPVAPTLPISSLSVNRQQVVFSTSSASSIATIDVYAHTLSSCPYAMIILSSIPQFLAFPAGTISSSAEMKSSSFIPYFFFRSASTCSFTASFSFPFNGLLANKISSSSPSITLFAFFSIWAPARWISRSVTQNTGSFLSSPMFTSTTSPSVLATTPWIASGKVTHWYFLIPP